MFHRHIFLVFSLLTVFIFFYPFFLRGLSPIPSDTIVGLYHPFRDSYIRDYPRGIPFKNFLITDPVRQIIPWKKLSVDILSRFQLPLWNPYEMAGKPLLANFQSSTFYPLNILLLIFPFSFGWSLMIFAQPLLAGIFLYLYLRKMNIHPAASTLGSIAFSFSGFTISWLEWNTIIQVALWLPLILFVKENLLKKFTLKWGLVLVFIECSAVFAGHLQVLFYSLIVSNAYLLSRIYQISKKRSKKNILSTMVRIYIPFLGLGVLVLLFTGIQWFPTLQFILQSARKLDQSPFTNPGWFIPWQHLIQFVAPDFFGNPTTLNYWGVWNYAEFVGYIGILPLIMALYALFFRHDRKTLFFGTFFFLSLIFSLPTLFAKIPYLLNIPFLSTTQPTRLLSITCFSLAVLSALGFDFFLQQRKGIIYPLGFFVMVFVLLWFAVLGNVGFIPKEHIIVARQNLILPTLLLTASIVFTSLYHFFSKQKQNTLIRYSILVGIGLIIVFDLLRFGSKFTPFTNQEYFFPHTKVIDFLQRQKGPFRIATTDSRIFPPNLATYYKIQSVEGYDPLYLRSYAEFIAASERGEPNISPPFGFNRIITPHNFESKFFDLLNVTYILSLSDLNSNKLVKVFQEGETRIYENKSVVPRVFFVERLKIINNNNEAIHEMFRDDFDPEKMAVVEVPLGAKLFHPLGGKSGRVEIMEYSGNRITIRTENDGDGFLVLTDAYYPTWHATVDGEETKIYRSDYHFRGLTVPKGTHRVEFYTTLF